MMSLVFFFLSKKIMREVGKILSLENPTKKHAKYEVKILD